MVAVIVLYDGHVIHLRRISISSVTRNLSGFNRVDVILRVPKNLELCVMQRFFALLRMTKPSFVIGEFCSNRSNVALPPLRQ